MIESANFSMLLLFIALTTNCTTVKNLIRLTPSDLSTYDFLNKKPHFVFNPAEARLLFRAISVVRGDKNAPKNLQKSKALLVCHADEKKQQCDLFPFLEKNTLTGKSRSINPKTFPKLFAFIGEIGSFSNIEYKSLVDVTCNFLGSTTPPFNEERLDCNLKNPRYLDEIIFDDAIAKELATLMIEEAGHQPGTRSINGTIRCNSSSNGACSVKANKTSKARNLKPTTSKQILREFSFTSQLLQKVSGVRIVAISQPYFATVTCQMAITSQLFACKVKI